MAQTKRPDFLQVESPYPGCRVANCGNEARNFHRGINYCAHHAREARDGDLSAILDINNCAKPHIYVFEAPELGLLKFGRSSNPDRRLKQISDGSPVEITMLGSCLAQDAGATEALIHAFLGCHKARIGWFKDCDDSRMIAGFILAGSPGEIIRLAKLLL